jgi:hypothetical protein
MLHTNSTKNFPTKTQTRNPRKPLPKIESESLTFPQIAIRFFAQHHLPAQQKYFWNPCWIPWQLHLEFFKNSKLCLMQALSQTPSEQKSNKIKSTICNSGSLPSLRAHPLPTTCPTSPHLSPAIPCPLCAEPRRRGDGKSPPVTSCCHC